MHMIYRLVGRLSILYGGIVVSCHYHRPDWSTSNYLRTYVRNIFRKNILKIREENGAGFYLVSFV